MDYILIFMVFLAIVLALMPGRARPRNEARPMADIRKREKKTEISTGVHA